MRISGPLSDAVVIERENRFRVRILLDGNEVLAHMADPGRLPELIFPGAKVLVRKVENSQRKTNHDLVLVRHRGKYVCVDTRIPNAVFHEALKKRSLVEFESCERIERERNYGHSRLDFVLSSPSGRMLVEVKSVTLVEGEKALFPDAPTIRGAKHLRELTRAVAEGEQSWLVFLCQRSDPVSVSPNERTDPDFARAMREAREAGVNFLGLTCRITKREIQIQGRIPVIL